MSFGLVALALAGSAAVQAQSVPSKTTPRMVTLTGCVKAGEKADTYVLTNVVTSDKAAVGTAGSGVAEPFYWLDSKDKLKPHVGHKVAITGTIDDDVDKTKVKQKDGEMKIERERTKEVKVPAGSSVAAATPEGTRAGYKVKVKSLKMIADSCS